MTKLVVLYAFDTMADWEYAHITTVVQAQARGGDERYRLLVASKDPGPVTTLGGLRVLPETTLEEIADEDVALLLLPGGNTWLDADHGVALDLARRRARGRSVPAADSREGRAERDKVVRRLVGMLGRKGYAPGLAFSVVNEVLAEFEE